LNKLIHIVIASEAKQSIQCMVKTMDQLVYGAIFQGAIWLPLALFAPFGSFS
jgi:hypothetical protein